MAKKLTELQRQRKLYLQQRRRLSKRGYVFEDEAQKASTPEEYQELRSELYEKAQYSRTATGEVISGKEGRSIERRRAARKGLETQAKKTGKTLPPIPEELLPPPPQTEQVPQDIDDYDNGEYYDLDDEQIARDQIDTFMESVAPGYSQEFTKDVIDIINDAIESYGSAIPVAQNIVNAKEALTEEVQAFFYYNELEKVAREHHYGTIYKHHSKATRHLEKIAAIVYGGQ